MSERERRLQDYLDRKLGDSEREEFEAETLESSALSEELMDELSLRELLTRRHRRARRVSPLRRISTAAVGLAAVAALVLFWPRGDVPEPVLRSDGPSTIEALEPTGRIEAWPTTFRWRAVDGATSYRIEVFDESGARVLGRDVERTSLSPDAPNTLPREGYWTVTALDAVGLEIGKSGPIRFTIDSP